MHDPDARDPAPLSAVVCAYTEDRWDLIGEALESLRRQTQRPAELMLVIDYNDALLERARAAFTDVTVVPNTNGKGLSGAKNTALQCSQQPFISVLDDDAAAAPNWIETLFAHFADPHVIAAGSAVDARWAHARPSWFPPEFDWAIGCSYVGLPRGVADVRNVFGGAMVMRRAEALEAGGFLSQLGRTANRAYGCEETEFCIRLRSRNAGSRIVFDPTTTVSHLVPDHRARWSYFVERCYGEGRSKATVTHHVGYAAGLASERSYLGATVPRGIVRDLRHGALARIAATLLGCAATASGFATGTVATRFSRRAS